MKKYSGCFYFKGTGIEFREDVRTSVIVFWNNCVSIRLSKAENASCRTGMYGWAVYRKGLVPALELVAREVARFIPAIYKQSEETQSYSSRSERRRDTFRNRRLLSWSFWSGRCFQTNDAQLEISGRTPFTTVSWRVLHRLCVLTYVLTLLSLLTYLLTYSLHTAEYFLIS